MNFAHLAAVALVGFLAQGCAHVPSGPDFRDGKPIAGMEGAGAFDRSGLPSWAASASRAERDSVRYLYLGVKPSEGSPIAGLAFRQGATGAIESTAAGWSPGRRVTCEEAAGLVGAWLGLAKPPEPLGTTGAVDHPNVLYATERPNLFVLLTDCSVPAERPILIQVVRVEPPAVPAEVIAWAYPIAVSREAMVARAEAAIERRPEPEVRALLANLLLSGKRAELEARFAQRLRDAVEADKAAVVGFEGAEAREPAARLEALLSLAERIAAQPRLPTPSVAVSRFEALAHGLTLPGPFASEISECVVKMEIQSFQSQRSPEGTAFFVGVVGTRAEQCGRLVAIAKRGPAQSDADRLEDFAVFTELIGTFGSGRLADRARREVASLTPKLLSLVRATAESAEREGRPATAAGLWLLAEDLAGPQSRRRLEAGAPVGEAGARARALLDKMLRAALPAPVTTAKNAPYLSVYSRGVKLPLNIANVEGVWPASAAEWAAGAGAAATRLTLDVDEVIVKYAHVDGRVDRRIHCLPSASAAAAFDCAVNKSNSRILYQLNYSQSGAEQARRYAQWLSRRAEARERAWWLSAAMESAQQMGGASQADRGVRATMGADYRLRFEWQGGGPSGASAFSSGIAADAVAAIRSQQSANDAQLAEPPPQPPAEPSDAERGYSVYAVQVEDWSMRGSLAVRLTDLGAPETYEQAESVVLKCEAPMTPLPAGETIATGVCSARALTDSFVGSATSGVQGHVATRVLGAVEAWARAEGSRAAGKFAGPAGEREKAWLSWFFAATPAKPWPAAPFTR